MTTMSSFPDLQDHIPESLSGAGKTGLWFLLAVITSLFMLLLIAMLVRAQYADWEPLTEAWQPLARLWPLWANTAVLAGASAALQWACNNARHGNFNRTLNLTLLAGALSCAFVGGQFWVWHLLLDNGIGVAGNPANSFFYLLTGLHALHIVGGLVAWARVVLTSQQLTQSQLRSRLQLCATYWHYLLGIWLVLFALLTCSPQTYRSIAAFCGF